MSTTIILIQSLAIIILFILRKIDNKSQLLELNEIDANLDSLHENTHDLHSKIKECIIYTQQIRDNSDKKFEQIKLDLLNQKKEIEIEILSSIILAPRSTAVSNFRMKILSQAKNDEIDKIFIPKINDIIQKSKITNLIK